MRDVTAALLIYNSKCLIARRPPGDPLAGYWEFPGGKVEKGETPEECLVREMEEEFGITIHIKDYFMNSIYHYERGTIRLLAYWVEWVGGEMVPTAHDKIAWVDNEDIGGYEFLPADVPIVERMRKL